MQAGHVLVGDGVVLAGLHAGLALAQLGAPDPDELEDPPSEQALLAPGGAGHAGLDDLGRPVGEDLQGDRGGVGAVGHPLLDDPPRLVGQLVHRNRLDAWHTLPLSIGVTDRSSSVITRTIRSEPIRIEVPVSMNPSSVLLTDRVAVVTGGGAGIGRGIARGLAAFGAKVAIWERDPRRPRWRPPRRSVASASPPMSGVRRGRRGPGPHHRRARPGQHPGQQRRRGVLLLPARDVGERLRRPLPGQPQARDRVHPAGGPLDGRDGHRVAASST